MQPLASRPRCGRFALYWVFMKYLGIDFGSKRVGIAMSDAHGTIAFPREVVVNDDSLLSFIVELGKKEHVEAFVIGDTRTHGGAENPVTAKAEEFVAALEEATRLPVERVSEAWSSIEASRYAPLGKEHDDAAAAAFILQRFLDMRKRV